MPFNFSGQDPQEGNFSHHITSSVWKTANGFQDVLYLASLDSRLTAADEATNIRDAVQTAFAELGIEIAFSGKGNNEKGVIIDMDEGLMKGSGLHPDGIKFGQTVVRVGSPPAEKSENLSRI